MTFLSGLFVGLIVGLLNGTVTLCQEKVGVGIFLALNLKKNTRYCARYSSNYTLDQTSILSDRYLSDNIVEPFATSFNIQNFLLGIPLN